MKKIGWSLLICLALLVIFAVPVFAAASAQEAVPLSFEVTPASLGAIAGVVISLLFSYIPKLNVLYAELAPEVKQLIMLGVLLATSLVLYFLNCGGIISTGITCDKNGIVQLITIFISTLIANQSAFTITPRVDAVKVAAEQAQAESMRDAHIGAP